MASSNSLQPIRHHYHHRNNTLTRHRRHSLDSSLAPHNPPPPPPSTSTSSPGSLFLKHRQQHYWLTSKLPGRNLFSAVTSSISTGATSAPTTTATTTTTTPFDALRRHLSAGELREADDETRRLLIQLAGESAVKRGYVYFSEVQFIAKEDLRAIDELWREHTEGRYGYSVQRKIWKKLNCDFSRFFINVGWMKKLENSEIEQYNYRSFPTEFIWEMKDDNPDGHLPLTNALRGTQLLTSIFNHPAFVELEEEEEEGGSGAPTRGFKGGDLLSGETSGNSGKGKEKKKKSLTQLFKPDYSF